MKNVRVLDCTLRDGGYINNWKFGKKTLNNIIRDMVDSEVDLLEVGFLKTGNFTSDHACFNTIQDIKRILPSNFGNTEFVVMCLYTNYDIAKLEECDGTVPYIRVTFHNYDINEGLAFCREVKSRGYKLFVNPINIMGYSDHELLCLIDKINKLSPYGFSVVDTFGSMRMMDLQRIYGICENNLNEETVLGLHLHENMSMAFSLAQRFLEIKMPARNCVIDASLYGMGRVPGNLCMELVMDYLNKVYGKKYNLDSALDAIENYIIPIKKKSTWGYSTEYFLSAKYNLHRNYVEYFQKKGRLTTKDINNILGMIPLERKSAFDANYAENLYLSYQNKVVDDAEDFACIKEIFQGKNVLAIAPGKQLQRNGERIVRYVAQKKPIIVTINFCYEEIKADYIFFSNIKRFFEYQSVLGEIQTIVTSNIMQESESGYVINYGRLAFDGDVYYDNSGIMMLRLLSKCGVKEIALAGFDGFSDIGGNYVDNYFGDFVMGESEDNGKIKTEIDKLRQENKIFFVTKSLYAKKEE